MVDFRALFAERKWMPLRNCPGRFVLVDADGAVSLSDLAGDLLSHEFRLAAARDVVVVTPLPDGGLISYKRADGRLVHTLNTPDGFARKLAQLGISLRSQESPQT